MRKVLTFTEYIRAGVLNRNSGLGTIATVKKVVTDQGTKVIFSDKMLKRTLWDYLSENNSEKWEPPVVSNVGGVEQKVSTIIDSEELDFSGTFVAKPFPYQRLRTFAPTYGISVNNYKHNMEFLTNMGLVKQATGDAKTSIYNREQFYGLYVLSGYIDLGKIGEQTIEVPKKIKVAEFDDEAANTSIEDFWQVFYETVTKKINDEQEAVISVENFEVIANAFVDMSSQKPSKGTVKFIFELSEDKKEFFAKGLSKVNGKKAPIENLIKTFSSLFKSEEDEQDAKPDMDADTQKDQIWRWIKEYIKSYDLKESSLALTIKQNSGKQSTTRDKIDPPKNNEKSTLMRWLYEDIFKEHMRFTKEIDPIIKKRLETIKNIEVDGDSSKDKYIVKISLTPEEKARRVKLLIDGLQKFHRLIEGRMEILTPVYSIWSTELPTPIFHNNIQRVVKVKQSEPPEVNINEMKKIAGDARLHCGEFFSDFQEEVELEIDAAYGVKQNATD